jgi:predicted dehydrogenase
VSAGTERRAILIGCGAVAVDHHLPRIQALLGIRNVVLVERDAARREWLAKTVARGPGLEISARVPDGRFALAVIATPPAYHADGYAAVADRSDAVLIEKPLALGVAEAEAIVRHAEASGVPVYVNLIRRGLESYRLLRELLEQEDFGALQQVSFAEGGVFSWNATSLGSFSREQGGGGVLMDTGAHALDLLLQVFAQLELEEAWMDAEGGGIEANCTLGLRADKGVPVTLCLSRNRHLSNRCVFEFEGATCTLDVRDEGIDVRRSGGAHYTIRPAGALPGAVDFNALFDRFYRDRLLGGEREGVGPQQSLAALRVIEDAYTRAAPMSGLGGEF